MYSVDITGVQQFTRGHGIKKKMHEVVEKPDLDLKACLEHSDVVISGVPSKDFKIATGDVRDGAVCINFSTEKASSVRFSVHSQPLTPRRISHQASRKRPPYIYRASAK